MFGGKSGPLNTTSLLGNILGGKGLPDPRVFLPGFGANFWKDDFMKQSKLMKSLFPIPKEDQEWFKDT